MIRVIYVDKTTGTVADEVELEKLIREGEVVAFYRKEVWIPVKGFLNGALPSWQTR